jgi:hypothetical protein
MQIKAIAKVTAAVILELPPEILITEEKIILTKKPNCA